MSARNIERKQARRLLDILNYPGKALEIVRDIDPRESEDFEVRYLVLERCLEIGEASRHLTDETAALSGLPVAKMRGMRNLIAYDYNRVDRGEVLKTVREDIPLLLGELGGMEKDLGLAARLELPPK